MTNISKEFKKQKKPRSYSNNNNNNNNNKILIFLLLLGTTQILQASCASYKKSLNPKVPLAKATQQVP
jgi:hypothetical protein